MVGYRFEDKTACTVIGRSLCRMLVGLFVQDSRAVRSDSSLR